MEARLPARPRLGLLVRLLAAAGLAGAVALHSAGPAWADETRWRIVTEQSELIIHVQPAGLFSPVLQSHDFVPAEWRGTMAFDPHALETVQLEVVVLVDSFVNQQDALSEEDRATVAEQVRSADVLDAARYPEVRVVGRELRVDERLEEGEVDPGMQGTLVGEITIRGVTQPIEIPFGARWSEGHLRATGHTTLRQTDFGIEPYSRFLGTVGVANEVEIEFSLEAVPE